MVATSHEALDLSTSLTVRRQDGSLSPFNRDLLLISLYEACKHRTDSVQVASALLQTVIANLTAQHVMHATVDRNSIITCAHDVLKRLDTSAAAVYQAYHKQSS
ncbi:MAG TPA: hypothetical protein VF733_05560 [Candidatus Saccharimonadales bacterium]